MRTSGGGDEVLSARLAGLVSVLAASAGARVAGVARGADGGELENRAGGDLLAVAGATMTDDELLEISPDTIIAFVRERGHVSFAELLQHFRGAKGSLCLELTAWNWVLWDGLSEAMCAALKSDRVRAALVPEPCSVFVYLCDGLIPQLPIVSQKRKYRQPHWLPVVFNVRQAVH
jgi:hypothetical protein